MTELETLMLQKFSEFSIYQEKQFDALRALVELQSSRSDDLTKQLQDLSLQLDALARPPED